MRTPIEFTKNLRAGIVTKDMLCSCLYSVNKRAKNARDKEKQYNYSDYGDRYAERYAQAKEEYYDLKEKLLKYSTNYLSCIHKVRRNAKKKVYDYEEEYWNLNEESIIRRGEFWDDTEDDYTKFALITYVKYEYFLFYEIGDYSFHHPLDEDNEVKLAKKYNLQIIEIDDLTTYGKDYITLLSVQFVKKVLASLEDGTATTQKE